MRISKGGRQLSALYDFCVVGAGIVGVATALRLTEECPDARVIILEKEEVAGHHQSSRNSGVVHSGIYYDPDSFKASLCLEGNHATKSFCSDHGIELRETGKLIVASRPEEVKRLAHLRDRAQKNRVPVRLLTGDELREMEPSVNGEAALLVESAAITDYAAITAAMATLLADRGVEIAYGREVTQISESDTHVDVLDSTDHSWRARYLVACAGLHSDRIARMAGLDPQFRIVPFRGEYYRLPDRLSGIVSRPIYPVPDPAMPFLGIHLTPMINGKITVGPNAVPGLARDRYAKSAVSFRDVSDVLSYPGSWRLARRYWRTGATELRNSWWKRAYLRECRRYCPSLTFADLEPYPAGIRAQAVTRDGSMVQDFIFLESARSVHVGNAPSPAATSAIPIARNVVHRLLERNR